jgi:hypothetical protein
MVIKETGWTECWNTGMMKGWNIAKRLQVSFWVPFAPIIPLFHYSIIPTVFTERCTEAD